MFVAPGDPGECGCWAEPRPRCPAVCWCLTFDPRLLRLLVCLQIVGGNLGERERFERVTSVNHEDSCPTGMNSSVFVALEAEVNRRVCVRERETCERARDDITTLSVPAGDPIAPPPIPDSLWTGL